MAFILTPQGVETLEGVPSIMDSPEVYPDSIEGIGAVGQPLFNRQLIVTGLPSAFQMGVLPRLKFYLHVNGFAD